MRFEQVMSGRWESDSQVYSAAMLSGPKRELKGIKEAQYIILSGDYKGNTVYRLYEQHVGRKEFIKRFKTLEAAVKAANKELEA